MSDIMMIEGLVGFGDLGQEIEDSVFPAFDESEPLWDDGMGPAVQFPDDGYSMEPGAEADYSPEDYGVDPAEAKEKLQEILESRREVVAQAALERQAEQQKVLDLEAQVTKQLPAEIQSAAAAGDLQRAQYLQAMQQQAAYERLMAARRVVDLAKLQVVAGQMAKNSRAQIALATLYEQAKKAGDTQITQELSQAYVDIGSMTEQYKQLRERQFQATKAARFRQEIAKRSQTLIKLAAAVRKATNDAARERLQAAMEREKAGIESLRRQAAEAKAAAEATPERLEGFLGGLGEMVPYCSVIQRSSGGWFQCNEMKQLDLGDVAGALDGLDGLDGINDKLMDALKAVGNAGEYVAKKSVCPMTTSISATINKAAVSADEKKDEAEEVKKKSSGDKARAAAAGIALATTYGTASVVAADAVAKMCDSGSGAKGKTIIVEEKRRGLPWWVIPGGVLLVGAGAAVILMGRSPAPRQTQGLGRLGPGKKRRRHKKARKHLGCNCG